MADGREAGARSISAWLGPLAIAVAISPIVQRSLLHPETLPDHLGWWLACVAVFAAVDQVAIRRSGPPRFALLALASVLACVAIWLIPVVYGGAALTATLLVLVAARLHDVAPRHAMPWILAQSLVLVSVYVSRWSVEVGISAAFGFFGFQVIGYRFSRTAASERRARTALARTRVELEAAARRAERNQIAADLHDVLGHHLVALQLQLEAARGDGCNPHLEQARQLSRLLLAEVRGVVDEMQKREDFDFVHALQEMHDERTHPPVTVDVRDDRRARAMPAAAARECFRAVQEAVTNARKHARAARIALRIDTDAIEVQDDGASWSGALQGRGISGMTERCRAAGCGFAIERIPGEGTTVRMSLPAEARA
jgi:signal transduction histidine kinase